MFYQEFQQTCMARIVNLGKGARGGGGFTLQTVRIWI